MQLPSDLCTGTKAVMVLGSRAESCRYGPNRVFVLKLACGVAHHHSQEQLGCMPPLHTCKHKGFETQVPINCGTEQKQWLQRHRGRIAFHHVWREDPGCLELCHMTLLLLDGVNRLPEQGQLCA